MDQKELGYAKKYIFVYIVFKMLDMTEQLACQNCF